MDTNRYKETLERELELLQKMRDELRLQMHLAKADAKDEWNRLEKNWAEMQAEMKRLGEEAKEPVKQLNEATKSLLDELKKGYERVKTRFN